MAENKVRLTNGRYWTAQQFLDHYRGAQISGVPTPVGDAPRPVDVDRSWYMDEGPGRYYHPGMFPIINQIANNRNLAPGTHDLSKLATGDNDLKARISHYATEMSSADHPLRALVFGDESAKIAGQVVVNPNGSKTFKQIEIRPFDTNFDFEHNTGNVPLEIAREMARRNYDPENQGVRYEIQYRGPGPNSGTGRIYDAFSDSQLNAALQKEFIYPRSGPPWLLPSVTGKPPLPYVEEHRQYLDQANGTEASASNAGDPSERFVPPANPNSSSNDIGKWLASLAGVDPSNPARPAPPQSDNGLRDFYRDDPAWLLQLRR